MGARVGRQLRKGQPSRGDFMPVMDRSRTKANVAVEVAVCSINSFALATKVNQKNR